MKESETSQKDQEEWSVVKTPVGNGKENQEKYCLNRGFRNKATSVALVISSIPLWATALGASLDMQIQRIDWLRSEMHYKYIELWILVFRFMQALVNIARFREAVINMANC